MGLRSYVHVTKALACPFRASAVTVFVKTSTLNVKVVLTT